jgi:hypothetical protein
MAYRKTHRGGTWGRYLKFKHTKIFPNICNRLIRHTEPFSTLSRPPFYELIESYVALRSISARRQCDSGYAALSLCPCSTRCVGAYTFGVGLRRRVGVFLSVTHIIKAPPLLVVAASLFRDLLRWCQGTSKSPAMPFKTQPSRLACHLKCITEFVLAFAGLERSGRFRPLHGYQPQAFRREDLTIGLTGSSRLLLLQFSRQYVIPKPELHERFTSAVARVQVSSSEH